MPAAGDAGISPGVLLAPYGSGAIVYDTITETAHLVDAPTRAILDGEPAGTGAPDDDPTDDPPHTDDDRLPTERRRAELHDLGLLGRGSAPEPDEPVRLPAPTSESDDVIGATHVLHDLHYAFTGPDATLIHHLDAFSGPSVPNAPDTLFRVVEDPAGVDLHVDTHWRFPNLERLLHQLPTALNRIAARSDRHPILHAAGVRTPGGHLLLVTGAPDAGKSTLTAQLVRHGCDYLGDESVAVLADLRVLPNPKPLTLDPILADALHRRQHVTGDHGEHDPPRHPHVPPTTLRADAVSLTGPTGPVAAIVEVRHDPAHPGEAVITELEADHAIRRVLANTLNLARGGESGLRVLADLAWSTPVLTLEHGNGPEAARLLIETADAARGS